MGRTATTRGVTLDWAAATDVGNERAVNEDAVLASPPVFVVADGMGGHQAGDVASGLVVDRFGSIVDGGLNEVQDVVGLLDDVNESILQEGRRSVVRAGMGTTAVGLLLVDNGDRASWLVFNIGDSRAYRLAGGELEQLSVDHSYVQELVDAGQISASSARTHPHRNVVTRALGVEEGPQPDIWLRAPAVGERFLLCTDGLSSEVDDRMIRRDLAGGSAQEAAQRLVDSALAAGGHDNVTVLVVDVLDVDDPVATEVTAPREAVVAPAEIDASDAPPGATGGDSASGHASGPMPQDGMLIDRVPAQAELADAGASDALGDAGGPEANDNGVRAAEEGRCDIVAIDPDAEQDRIDMTEDSGDRAGSDQDGDVVPVVADGDRHADSEHGGTAL